MKRIALTLAAAGLMTSCGYYAKEEGQRLANEVHALQTQASAIQQALQEIQESSKKQTEQLSKLDREVTQLNAAARRNDADLGVQIDQALQQVARLKGFIESTNDRLATLESAINKVQEEVDLRFQTMQEQSRVAELKSQADKAKAAADAERAARLLTNPSTFFAEVERMIKDGKPSEARKLLREFTIRAKGDRSLEKSLPDALFYIGETYFAEGNFQQAAAEYNGVRKNHPKSPKVAEALYKLGQCFEKLNLPEDAKLFYQTILKSHAKSGVARDAKARLDALK